MHFADHSWSSKWYFWLEEGRKESQPTQRNPNADKAGCTSGDRHKRLARAYAIWDNPIDIVPLYGVEGIAANQKRYASMRIGEIFKSSNGLERRPAKVRKYIGIITGFTNRIGT